ncbi:MAG: S8 family serine peptidase [Actinomycetaceae bacterium]|nr:S8 family serine peptidase [Actinomycetaceae bacterium]
MKHSHKLLFRAGACLSAATVSFGLCIGAGVPAHADDSVDKLIQARVTGGEPLKSGNYVVVLKDPSVSTYRGNIHGLRSVRDKWGKVLLKSQAAKEYTDHLTKTQNQVAKSVGAKVKTRTTVALNSMVVKVSKAQAEKMALDPKVSRMYKEELLHPTAFTPANESLGLQKNFAANLEGGWQNAGKGIVVGIIDSGIAPENPLFKGQKLTTTKREDTPYIEGDNIVFKKSDGGTFRGLCQQGVQFSKDMCNTKLISAKAYYRTHGEEKIAGPEKNEYLSPRDGSGHGSHTASTAAGNYGVDVSFPEDTPNDGVAIGKMAGVAPAAKIAAYKVCWEDKGKGDEGGCSNGDIVDAIDDATKDGVDVINFSIGGGASRSAWTLIDQAFYGAAAAGVFVAASAGNSGPGADTLDHTAPWYTTVGASTVKGNYEGTVEFADHKIAGATVSVPFGKTVDGTLVWAGDLAAAGKKPEDAKLCKEGSLDPAKAKDKVVLCERGEIARVDKSKFVKAAGGKAVILVNPKHDSLDLDAHSIPTVHIDGKEDGSQYKLVLEEAKKGNAQVTLWSKNTTGTPTPAPQMAGFSSRGPASADTQDMIKPDITAPGVGILAAIANPKGSQGKFGFMSGTSMSSPHIAGMGAVLLSKSPKASPMAVKSALMTTTFDSVNADGQTDRDPFAQGAGHVDPSRMFDPGVEYISGTEDWAGYLRGMGYNLPEKFVGKAIDPSDLNVPSIAIGSLVNRQTVTRELTAVRSGTYRVSASMNDGVSAQVEPQVLTFDKSGEKKQFKVTFSSAPLYKWATGMLTWTRDGAQHGDRIPMAVKGGALSLEGNDVVHATGAKGSATFDFKSTDVNGTELHSSGLHKLNEIFNKAGTPDKGPSAFIHGLMFPQPGLITEVLKASTGKPDTEFTLLIGQFASLTDKKPKVYEVDSADLRDGVSLPYLEAGKSTLVLVADMNQNDTVKLEGITLAFTKQNQNGFNTEMTPNPEDAAYGQLTSSWNIDKPVAKATYAGANMLKRGDDVVRTVVLVDPTEKPVALTLKATPEKDVKPGDTVKVTGTGYKAGEDVTISFDGMNVATVKAGEDGNVAYDLVISEDATPGAHEVKVTQGEHSATVTVTTVAAPTEEPNPAVSLDKSTLKEEDLPAKVTATATGFPMSKSGDAKATFYLDGKEVATVPLEAQSKPTAADDTERAADAQALGDATATFEVPKSTEAGTHTVKVQSGDAKAEASLVVEKKAEAPEPPTPGEPGTPAPNPDPNKPGDPAEPTDPTQPGDGTKPSDGDHAKKPGEGKHAMKGKRSKGLASTGSTQTPAVVALLTLAAGAGVTVVAVLRRNKA